MGGPAIDNATRELILQLHTIEGATSRTVAAAVGLSRHTIQKVLKGMYETKEEREERRQEDKENLDKKEIGINLKKTIKCVGCGHMVHPVTRDNRCLQCVLRIQGRLRSRLAYDTFATQDHSIQPELTGTEQRRLSFLQARNIVLGELGPDVEPLYLEEDDDGEDE